MDSEPKGRHLRRGKGYQVRNLVDVLALLASYEVSGPIENPSSMAVGLYSGVKWGLLGLEKAGGLGELLQEQGAEWPNLNSHNRGFAAGLAVGTRHKGLYTQAEILAAVDEVRANDIEKASTSGGMVYREFLGTVEDTAGGLTKSGAVVYTDGLRDAEVFKPKPDNSRDEWRMLRAIECLRSAYVSVDEEEREENLVLAYVLVKKITSQARGGEV